MRTPTHWRFFYAVAIKAGRSNAEAHDVVQETVVAVARQMCDWGFDRQRGHYAIWFANGRREEFPILCGRDARDWHEHPGAAPFLVALTAE